MVRQFFNPKIDLLCYVQVGSNISEDQLTAIAERAIVEAKQNLDGPQEVGLGFDDFNRAMKATEIEAKMSVRFHD